MATKSIIQKPKEKNNIAEKQITAPKSVEDVKDYFDRSGISDDPKYILKQAQEDINNGKGHIQQMDSNSIFYKAYSLFEFEKGILMSSAVPNRYITFSIEFCRNLQKEYKCETPSEKATAELVAINFVRTLEIQYRITANLERKEYGDLSIRRLEVLSKELDRANRHYINSLQTLKMIKQPMLELNIKTQTAVIGQNQIVQSNNK